MVIFADFVSIVYFLCSGAGDLRIYVFNATGGDSGFGGIINNSTKSLFS